MSSSPYPRRVTTTPDLGRLKQAVDEAVLASRRPPTPDAESWPFTFPHQHLAPEAWRQVYGVVRFIREQHGTLFQRFLREGHIAFHIVDYLAREKEPTLRDLVRALRAVADRESKWIISVPICNLTLPRETVPLSKYAMLVRTDAARGSGRRFGSHLVDPWAVERHLGDRLTPWARREKASRDGWPVIDIDTRMTAALTLVEEGVEELAVDVAQARTRLAVAMWCALKPPRVPGDPHPLWPSVGGWTPAAFLEYKTLHKAYEPTMPRRASRRGNSIVEHAAYQLTRSDTQLRAPFTAMDAALAGSRCALSLLSAARSLFLAQQVPNNLERSEQVLQVWCAREALTDPGRRRGDRAERWRHLTRNLRLERELVSRGYDRDEVQAAFKLSESVRNLAAHRADDVLLNLNYPGGLRAQRGASLSAVASDWPILLVALRIAVRRLSKRAARVGWSDQWFEAHFH
jgi:hypothetical protein